MPRAIVRFSLDNEQSNITGNAIRKDLEELGAEKIGTGAYELDNPDLEAVIDAMQSALEMLKHPAGGGRVDHFWLYLDHTDQAS